MLRSPKHSTIEVVAPKEEEYYKAISTIMFEIAGPEQYNAVT